MGTEVDQWHNGPVHQEVPEDFVHSANFVKGSAYSDLYRASRANGTKLAIKRLRFYSEKDKNMLIAELHTWSSLHHTNIARLNSYSFDSYEYPLIVTDWTDSGSAWDYVHSDPDANVLLLLAETADALAYIHDMQAVHSDVKSDNILVSSDGHAKLCDFGVSRMVSASSSMANLSTGPTGTIRYLAYEFLSGSSEEMVYSTKSDVWAFGMTVYELMTRKRPYDGLSEAKICLAIMDVQRPVFPELLESYTTQTRNRVVQQDLRSLCDDCWNINARERIDMTSIVLRLKQVCGYDSTLRQRRPPARSDSGSSTSSSSSDSTLCGSDSGDRKTFRESENRNCSSVELPPKERMHHYQEPDLKTPSLLKKLIDQILCALRALHIVR